MAARSRSITLLCAALVAAPWVQAGEPAKPRTFDTQPVFVNSLKRGEKVKLTLRVSADRAVQFKLIAETPSGARTPVLLQPEGSELNHSAVVTLGNEIALKDGEALTLSYGHSILSKTVRLEFDAQAGGWRVKP